MTLRDYCQATGEEWGIGYYSDYHQSFIPTTTYGITKFVFRLRRDASPDFTGNWVSFAFREAEADGKPKGDILFSAHTPWESLSTSFSSVEIVLGTDVKLTIGQPYCISLGWGGGSALGVLAYWSYDSTLSCGLNLWLYYAVTSPYWFDKDGAVWFEVWGVPPVPGHIWVEDTDSPANRLHIIDSAKVEQTNLAVADVDDTPVDGATTAPISSRWAYDYEQLWEDKKKLIYLGL